jgi:hypothetical protein
MDVLAVSVGATRFLAAARAIAHRAKRLNKKTPTIFCFWPARKARGAKKIRKGNLGRAPQGPRPMFLFKRAADPMAALNLAMAQAALWHNVPPSDPIPTAPKAKVPKAPNAKVPKAPKLPKARCAPPVPMEWAPTAPVAYRRRLLPTERHALSLRFEHRCAICRVLLPAGWHADHVVPLTDGGPDVAGNMQPLCPQCHTIKTAQENSTRLRARPRLF